MVKKFIRPIQRFLVKQRGAGCHGVISGLAAAQHEIYEILDEQPFVRFLEYFRVIFLHPDKTIEGVDMEHLFAGNIKDIFGTEFLTESPALRFRTGALPGNKGVEPLTVLIQGHAVHAQAGHGDPLDVGWISGLIQHAFYDRDGAVPDNVRIPESPGRVIRVQMLDFCRNAVHGDDVAR